jgi:CRISPR-associated protein Csm2
MTELQKKEWSKSDFDSEWIKSEFTDETIGFASWFGEYLTIGHDKYKLTTSQIRNVFGEIKRIQMRVAGEASNLKANKTDFLLLGPKIAYAAARAGKTDKSHKALDFKDVMTKAHNEVKPGTEGDIKRFENFCDFIEAILAYHKASGGK